MKGKNPTYWRRDAERAINRAWRGETEREEPDDDQAA
jgi:hypothetical protein